MKSLLWSATFTCLIALTGCSPFKQGVDAYTGMHYELSLSLLEPYASKAKSVKVPTFDATLDDETSAEQVARYITKDYFQGWEAYAGSQLGLNRPKDACDSIEMAMRPLRLRLGRRRDRDLTPWEGDFWQGEVFTLRAWWQTIPCEKTP